MTIHMVSFGDAAFGSSYQAACLGYSIVADDMSFPGVSGSWYITGLCHQTSKSVYRKTSLQTIKRHLV